MSGVSKNGFGFGVLEDEMTQFVNVAGAARVLAVASLICSVACGCGLQRLVLLAVPAKTNLLARRAVRILRSVAVLVPGRLKHDCFGNGHVLRISLCNAHN